MLVQRMLILLSLAGNYALALMFCMPRNKCYRSKACSSCLGCQGFLTHTRVSAELSIFSPHLMQIALYSSGPPACQSPPRRQMSTDPSVGGGGAEQRAAPAAATKPSGPQVPASLPPPPAKVRGERVIPPRSCPLTPLRGQQRGRLGAATRGGSWAPPGRSQQRGLQGTHPPGSGSRRRGAAGRPFLGPHPQRRRRGSQSTRSSRPVPRETPLAGPGRESRAGRLALGEQTPDPRPLWRGYGAPSPRAERGHPGVAGSLWPVPGRRGADGAFAALPRLSRCGAGGGASEQRHRPRRPPPHRPRRACLGLQLLYVCKCRPAAPAIYSAGFCSTNRRRGISGF